MSEETPHPLLAPPNDAMKKRTVKGVAATAAAQGVRFVVQIGSTIILARLLDPRAFGLVAMVKPVIGFASLIQELGLNQAIITAKTLTQGEAAALFKINALLAAGIAGIVALASPLVGYLYKEPVVTFITLAMAGNILAAGLTSSHRALLNRGMRFKSVAILDILSVTIAFAVAVVLAILNPGPWALVAQLIVTALVLLVGVWITTGWKPVGASPMKEVVPHLKFGMGMTGFNLSNFFSRNMDNVLIGGAHGPAALGFYDRAYQLMLFPIMQVNYPVAGVLVPVLSRLREESDRYRSAYLRTVRLMLLLTTPLVPFLVLTADVLIPGVLGEKWEPSVPIFVWLAPSALIQTMANTFGWLFVSQQRTTEFAKYGAFSAVVTVGSFLIGLPQGPVGVAMWYSLSAILLRLPAAIYVIGRKGPIRSMDIVGVFFPFLFASGVASGAWYILKPFLPSSLFWYLFLSFLIVYAIAWAIQWVLPGGRSLFLEAKDLPKMFKRG